MRMARVNVYLPDELAAGARTAELNVSALTQDAVRQALAARATDAWLDSLVPIYAGAAWHERETAEMFGIDFRGHPNLINLYLPQEFEGHPLRKSFALGARAAKPWPGTVDVEELPSTEKVEAGEGG